VIVLDTTVLVYAAGADHPLRDPCARLISAVAHGAIAATTTIEAIQEFAHVHGRRRPRAIAAGLARRYAEGLAPLLVVDADVLGRGLALFERHPALGAFDAVLAAAAMAGGAEALVSADRAFVSVPNLRFVAPATSEFDELLER
jgi:uncharacterized protein